MKNRSELVTHLNECLKNKDFKAFEKGLHDLNKSKAKSKITFKNICNKLKELGLKFTLHRKTD